MSNPIDAITENARRHFPGSDAEITQDGERWVLLVHDKGLTHRYSAPNLTALGRMSADLPEHEDEQDEWEHGKRRLSNGPRIIEHYPGGDQQYWKADPSDRQGIGHRRIGTD